ncbi:MAG: hypothetical protein ACFFCD_07530 [Promethearchaeota archaeon]
MSIETNYESGAQSSKLLMKEIVKQSEISQSKFFETFGISDKKHVSLVQKEKNYFVELNASGYKVTIFAGKTLKKAEKCYGYTLDKLKKGRSMLEPLCF